MVSLCLVWCLEETYDCGEFDHDGDTMALQLLTGSHATQLQDLGRIERTSRNNDLFRRGDVDQTA